MLQLRQLKILAALTTAETMRQPVCLLLTVCGMMLSIMVPLITAHNFGESGRLARDSGLAFQLMFGLILGAYAACASLDREHRSGTAAAILCKPVSRWTYFMAKFFGIVFVVGVFSCCAGLTTLLAERVAARYTTEDGMLIDRLCAWLVILSPIIACGIGGWANYRKQRAFPSTVLLCLPPLLLMATLISGCFTRTGVWHPFHLQLQWPILVAALLIALGLVMLSAIALALAVRLPLIPTVSICFGLLLTGLASDYAFGPALHHGVWAHGLYTLIPNWQHFWVADAIAGGGSVSVAYVARTALYAVLYTTGVLCLGGAAFQHAEVS